MQAKLLGNLKGGSGQISPCAELNTVLFKYNQAEKDQLKQ